MTNNHPKAMIALVGEQPMAVIIPVFQQRPQKLTLLCTRRTVVFARWIKEALALCAGTSGVKVVTHPELLDPYDPDNIREVCRKALQGASGFDLSLNITCGTKIMSMVAAQCSWESGARALYVRTEGKGSLITLKPDGVEEQSVNV